MRNNSVNNLYKKVNSQLISKWNHKSNQKHFWGKKINRVNQNWKILHNKPLNKIQANHLKYHNLNKQNISSRINSIKKCIQDQHQAQFHHKSQAHLWKNSIRYTAGVCYNKINNSGKMNFHLKVYDHLNENLL